MVRISSDLFNAIFFSKRSRKEEPKHSELFSAEAGCFEQNTIVLIPFIESRHWFLAAVDNEARQIKLYDSAGYSTPEILDIIEKWITKNWEKAELIFLADFNKAEIQRRLFVITAKARFYSVRF